MPKLRSHTSKLPSNKRRAGGSERESVEAVSIVHRITEDERRRLQRWIKRDPYTNCWIWGSNPDKYNSICWRGRNIQAHRLLLWLARGEPAQPGNHVHHKCGTPACVNPAHLLELTPRQHRQIHAR